MTSLDPGADRRKAVPELSVVVPVGPGDESWRGLLETLDTLDLAHETILSGCRPAPADLLDLSRKSAAEDVRWLVGEQGRARQLNFGVDRARSEIVWLLHADCRPEPEALRAVEHFVRTRSDTLGWFELAFATDGPSLTRLNAWGANLRSRLFALPFGDQGWIIKAGLIREMGGFDEDFGPGEDLDFAVRARAAGVRLEPLDATIHTSARRFADRGWLKTTATHLRLTLTLWIKSKIKPAIMKK